MTKKFSQRIGSIHAVCPALFAGSSLGTPLSLLRRTLSAFGYNLSTYCNACFTRSQAACAARRETETGPYDGKCGTQTPRMGLADGAGAGSCCVPLASRSWIGVPEQPERLRGLLRSYATDPENPPATGGDRGSSAPAARTGVISWHGRFAMPSYGGSVPLDAEGRLAFSVDAGRSAWHYGTRTWDQGRAVGGIDDFRGERGNGANF